MSAMIYLEDGSIFLGKGFGKSGTAVGELVFNTSMTGYGEILTDPSYAGQIITMTYPLIGNYGLGQKTLQSNQVYANGMIVKHIESHPGQEKALDQWLIEQNVVAICNVDTRAITKKIRRHGAMKCVITTEPLSVGELMSHIQMAPDNRSAMKCVGTQSPYVIEGKGPKVAILDFGIKNSILKAFVERGCEVKVFPYFSKADEVLAYDPDGIFLSNGPGDPETASEATQTIEALIGKRPIFGICMGHQLLARALGAKTFKMPYGHRGGNHGVYDKLLDRAFITSQNHGYAIVPQSLEDLPLEITHVNLNDDSIEGIRHKTYPVFSVQYHPEGGPGPNDSAYLFDQFLSQIKGGTYA